MRHPMSKHRWFSHVTRLCACVAVLLLAGCGLLPKQESIALYAPQPRITADPSWPSVRWQLQIARPHADDAHDSSRILVRPQPGELQIYKGAAWSQPVPDLVLDTLLRAFNDSGRLPGVARRGEGVNADYELLLDLRRFEADYTAANTPVTRVEIGARLVDNDANQVIATRVFTVDGPVGGTGIAQVTHSLETALGDATQQIVGWVLGEGYREQSDRRK